MIEIFCQSDIEKFRKTSVYPAVFTEFVHTRFNEIKSAMEEFYEEESEFNLKEFGHIVILQTTDNLRDLSEVGLNPCDNGFFGSVPEAVEEIIMPKFTAYEVAMAYNNSYMMQFLMVKGEFESIYPELQPYLEKWLHGKRNFKPKRSAHGK